MHIVIYEYMCVSVHSVIVYALYVCKTRYFMYLLVLLNKFKELYTTKWRSGVGNGAGMAMELSSFDKHCINLNLKKKLSLLFYVVYCILINL